MKPIIQSIAFASLVSLAFASGCLGTGDAESLFGNPGAGGGRAKAGAASATTGSTGSTPAGGSSSSGAPTPGTGTGNGSSEDCLDGVDNDANGLVDCADPACQIGFECVDADPEGFEGHYYVRETMLVDSAAEPCSADLEPTTDFAGAVVSPECATCSCGGLDGAACAPAGIMCWEESQLCKGALMDDLTQVLSDGHCHDQAKSNVLTLSCALTSPATLTTKGSCAPSAPALVHASPWRSRIDACGTKKAGAGCGAASVCVPKGSGEPSEALCSRREGSGDCPSNWPKSIAGFSDAVDTRACSPCECAAGTASCGNGDYTFYDLNECATAGESSNPIAVASTGCTNLTPLLDQGTWSVKATLPKPSGGCTPSGGHPTGTVTPKSPVTYCCK